MLVPGAFSVEHDTLQAKHGIIDDVGVGVAVAVNDKVGDTDTVAVGVKDAVAVNDTVGDCDIVGVGVNVGDGESDAVAV